MFTRAADPDRATAWLRLRVRGWRPVVALATVLVLAGCGTVGEPPTSPGLSNGGKCNTVDYNRCTYLF